MFYKSYEQQVRRAIVQVHSVCFYCKFYSSYNVDHIFPTVQGGQSYLLNLVGSCKKCNCDKGGKVPTLQVYHQARQYAEEKQYEVKARIEYWGYPVRWIDYIEPKYHYETELLLLKSHWENK